MRRKPGMPLSVHHQFCSRLSRLLTELDELMMLADRYQNRRTPVYRGLNHARRRIIETQAALDAILIQQYPALVERIAALHGVRLVYQDKRPDILKEMIGQLPE